MMERKQVYQARYVYNDYRGLKDGALFGISLFGTYTKFELYVAETDNWTASIRTKQDNMSLNKRPGTSCRIEIHFLVFNHLYLLCSYMNLVSIMFSKENCKSTRNFKIH